MTANPGSVALVCVAAGALPFEAFDINNGTQVATWEQYEADTTLVVASYDELEGGIPCGDDHWILVWRPEDPVSVDPLETTAPHQGCGKLFTWGE